MKMRNPIRAMRDGVVSEVMVQEGQSVGYDDLLLKFEEA
jgi:biotin carboxyl carrier protein